MDLGDIWHRRCDLSSGSNRKGKAYRLRLEGRLDTRTRKADFTMAVAGVYTNW